MARWRLLWIPVALAALAAVAVALLQAPDGELIPGDGRPGEDQPLAWEPGGAPTVPPRADGGAAPSTRAQALLSGVVVRQGAPVAGAVVTSKGAGTTRATSDAEGRFSFAFEGPAEVVVSARLGSESSAAVGPLALWPGQAQPQLTLELLPGAAVEGVVLDGWTRQPLPGARVRCPAGEAVADHAGRFAFEGLPAGQTWIEADAQGYLPRLEWLELEGARRHGGLQLSLARGAAVSGRVLRGTSPVPSATVWAERQPTGEARAPVSTDGQGRFQLALPEGAWALAAAAPGEGRVPGPLLQLMPDGKAEVELQLGERLDAHGTVQLDGQPLVGAQVLAMDAQSRKPSASGATGAGGAFTLGGVPVGRYLLQIRNGTAVFEAGPFEQTGEGQPWTVRLLGLGRLTGRVQPPSAGVRVRWLSPAWAGPLVETATDAQGRFAFEQVPTGPLTVEASGEAGAGTAAGKAGDEVLVTLGRSAIRLEVVDQTSRPVTDFSVRVRSLDTGHARTVDVLSPTGRWRLEVAPGTWELSVTAPGHVFDQAPATVAVTDGERDVRVALQAGVRVRGTVVDAQTGAPVEGAEVRFSRRSTGLPEAQTSPPLATDGNGRFVVHGVLPWSSMSVAKSGYQRGFAAWRAFAGNPDDVRVALVRGAPGPDPLAAPQPPYEGVGMALGVDMGRIVVTGTFPGSPAEAAGLRSGDVLLAVDRVPAREPLGQVVARIKGPAGTVVFLAILRGERQLEIPVRRMAIRL